MTQLGIAVAGFGTNSPIEVMHCIHAVERCLGRRFDFIEGMNSKAMMMELARDYPVPTIGSVFRPDCTGFEKPIHNFAAACELAQCLGAQNLMLGGAKYRQKYNLRGEYELMARMAAEMGLNLTIEGIAQTYPGNLEKVEDFHQKYRLDKYHVCLVNAQRNGDDVRALIDRVGAANIVSLHSDIKGLALYADVIAKVGHVTLEMA